MRRLPTVGEDDPCKTCALAIASREAGCPFHDVEWPAGALLLAQGETPTTLWHVREGIVLISANDAEGVETECALRGPGAVIGLEMLTGAPTAYEAWALSPVVVCRLDVESFRRWLGPPDTPAGVIAVKALEEAERQRRERIVLSGRAVARVARFLLERARLDPDAGPLPVEQQVLARMLAMKPETLSRALATLRRRGALFPDRQVRVASLPALSAAAEGKE